MLFFLRNILRRSTKIKIKKQVNGNMALTKDIIYTQINTLEYFRKIINTYIGSLWFIFFT